MLHGDHIKRRSLQAQPCPEAFTNNRGTGNLLGRSAEVRRHCCSALALSATIFGHHSQGRAFAAAVDEVTSMSRCNSSTTVEIVEGGGSCPLRSQSACIVSEPSRPPSPSVCIVSESPRPPSPSVCIVSESPRPPSPSVCIVSESSRPPSPSVCIVRESPRPPVAERLHCDGVVQAVIAQRVRDRDFETPVTHRMRDEEKGAVAELLRGEQQAHLVAHHCPRGE
ncbi:hypothetical protein MRX96_056812 [Rhipicephalus microplus]